MLGNLAAAISDYTRSIHINPDFPPNYHLRGLAHCARGEFDLAIVDCRRAIESNPRCAGAMVALGEANEGLGKQLEAIHWYGRALQHWRELSDDERKKAEAAISRLEAAKPWFGEGAR